MSFWLKRVESFLEQVDHTAATQIGSLKQGEDSSAANSDSTTYHHPQVATRTANGPTPSAKPKTSTTSAPPPKPRDDDIFKFLNDSDSTPPPSSVQRLAMPVPKPKKEQKPKKTATSPVLTPTPAPTPTLTSTPNLTSSPMLTPTPTIPAPTTQPTKLKTPPSPPSSTPTPAPPTSLPTTDSTLPSSPSHSTPTSHEPAQVQPHESESRSAHLELEPGTDHDKSEPTEPKSEPLEPETVEKGGWEDDVEIADSEASGKRSPVRAISPPLEDHQEVDGQKGDGSDKSEKEDVSEPARNETPDIREENVRQEVNEERASEVDGASEKGVEEGVEQGMEVAKRIEEEGKVDERGKEEGKAEEKEEERSVEEKGVEEKGEGGEGEGEGEGEEKEEEEGEEEEEEEEEEEGGLNAEFVQKYNDLITQNEKFGRENKLMRQEVVKLHEEIHSLTSKNRSVSDAMQQMTEVLSEHQKMAHDKDKQIIKMRQQEQELETALHAKDMQIAGARAQFEQVEKALRMRDSTIASYQEKIKELTQERENLMDGNQRNSLQIQNKLDELDRLMAEEKRMHMETHHHAKEREAELQAGLAEHTKALAIAQRGLDEKTLELQRSTIALKEAQTESKTLRQELVDYKLRATKVLQSKEKTIQELTERLSAGPEGGGNMTANLGELLRTQQELTRVQQERDELSHTVDQLRANLQEVQAQAEADAEVFHSQLASSEELLEKERKRVQALQLDHLTRTNESASAYNEAERSLAELKETLKARDSELAKLKKQLASKSQSSSSQMELENRLRSTTDHLLQKQAQIDTLLSEKSFLQLQLENTLQATQRDLAYKKRERNYPNKNEHIPISIKTSGPTDDDDHEPRIRQRPIASLVPTNPYNPNFVSQRVVGAANFLDKMSASAGRVMRQYPLARLGVIAYIVLIHLMGFYILASWNPEMHVDGLEEKPPGT
eukprot:Phypoly_transcript_01966.p1 GENE.Phypoly_transcript_01966~~Phypoly_transcript_01966.p1  ORF type:complete len:951 (+),score=286.64 Phypoly_transcript_01966:141-2993(+)